MEPLSSFAISLAAGIALNLFNKSHEKVSRELKSAFEKALRLWCKNDNIREAKRSGIKKQISNLLNNPEQLADIKINSQELNSFLDKYAEAIAEYQSAYNYIKAITDIERFRKEIKLLESINYIVLDNNQMLNELLKGIKKQKRTTRSKTVTGILKFRKHGIKSVIFEKQLDNFKSKKEYQKAINLIVKYFPNYPSWELLIELLKFCDLESKPNYAISYFQKNRHLLGANPNDEQSELKEALNYYLGRMFTQIGNYQEAFSWHRNNTENNITNYFQLLSRFELACLHYITENFLLALKEFETILLSFKHIEHSIFLRIHVFLYLATVHVIKTIHNIPNSVNHKLVKLDPQKSIEYSNKALKLISELQFEDDKNDKLAWTYLTLAFGEESKGNFDKCRTYFVKSEELVKSGKTNNSSTAHLLIYISRFHRRSLEFQKALEKIMLIRKLLPKNQRMKIDSSIYEEISYILLEYGKMKFSRHFFKHAIVLFKNEPSIELKMHWPIVERLSKSCKELSLDFDLL